MAVDSATPEPQRWWSKAASAVGGYRVLVLWFLPPLAIICGWCALAIWYASRLDLEGTVAQTLIFVLAMSQVYAFLGSLGWIFKVLRWLGRMAKKTDPASERAVDWWMSYVQEKFGSDTSQPDVEASSESTESPEEGAAPEADPLT